MSFFFIIFSHILQEEVCFSLFIEKKCGALAMDTYAEILQKVYIGPECQGVYDLLPEVIRLRKLEIEKGNKTAKTSKRRK